MRKQKSCRGRTIGIALGVFLVACNTASANEKWIVAAELKAPTPTVNDQFGTSVAMDGDYIVVGVPFATYMATTDAGLAHVYHRNGNAWLLVDTLHSSSWTANAHFGSAVAIHGEDIIVGAPDSDFLSAANTGSITIFALNHTSGHFEEALSLSANEANQRMGAAVTVGAAHAIAGLAGPVSGVFQDGEAFSWPKSQGGWVNGPDSFSSNTVQSQQRFGASVAVYEESGDNATQRLVVGAPQFDLVTAEEGGLIYVFKGIGFPWMQTQALFEVAAAPGDGFGAAVAISADYVFGSSTSRDKPGGPTAAGSVTAYRWSGTAYGFDQELFPAAGTSNSKFGSCLSYDLFGSTAHLLVGAPLGNEGATLDSGSAILFSADRSPASWTQQTRLSLGAGAVAGDHFGTSVALRGIYAAIGAPMRKVTNHANAGAVEIFLRDDIFANDFEVP